MYFWCHPEIVVAWIPWTFPQMCLYHFRKLDLKFDRKRQPQHDKALRGIQAVGYFEHCRPSNDFPWYSFLPMPSWSAVCSSGFGFRAKRLLNITFVKPSFEWIGSEGQWSRTVRLELRIGELEQLKKLCLYDVWLDVSIHSSNCSELICKVHNWAISSYRYYHKE